MAELSNVGVDATKSAVNGGEASAAEADASTASAIDGRDRSFESARVATTNSGSLSVSPPSPVESLEAGFYKVRVNTVPLLCVVQKRNDFSWRCVLDPVAIY